MKHDKARLIAGRVILPAVYIIGILQLGTPSLDPFWQAHPRLHVLTYVDRFAIFLFFAVVTLGMALYVILRCIVQFRKGMAEGNTAGETSR